jgi:hypothetical protein
MAMNQAPKTAQSMGQVSYMGRWVDRMHFRAFVYSSTEQKVAESYEEFEKLISSGIWFITKADAEKANSKKIIEDSAENIQKSEVKSTKTKIKDQLKAAAVEA